MEYRTRHGIALTNASPNEGYPFQILHNPFNGKESDIPGWLKKWGFANEYHAGFCLHYFLYYKRIMRKSNKKDFKIAYIGALRLIGNNSVGEAWIE